VKGYYDEQFLASTHGWQNGVDNSGGSETRGTVFPVPGLDSREVSDYEYTWSAVAWVTLIPSSPAYNAKMKFGDFFPETSGGTPTSTDGLGVLDKRTEVALCFERIVGGGIGRPCSGRTPPITACTQDTKNNGYWFARVTSWTGTRTKPDVKYACVTYRPTKDNTRPPAVVRWRWLAKDDIIWVDCPFACCEAEVQK
jgi:hypothetical protein